MFIYLFLRERETERENTRGGGAEKERGTQNPKQAPGSDLKASSERDVGLELTNYETTT